MQITRLDDWEKAILPKLRTLQFKKAPIDNLTLLAYFFWDDDRIETKFYTIECTFLCAYHAFGLAPSILVVNRTTPYMEEFCRRYSIELQVDPALTGGVPTMNLDCVCKLHARFKTDYVAIIQSDGIIVNGGLEKFVGPYDYVGAPWVLTRKGFDWPHRRKFPVGNGGLCVRSKAICEAASKAYAAFWRHLPYSWFVSDDVFYSKTMPMISRKWRRTFRYPDIETAAEFSIENCVPAEQNEAPVGFHAQAGFESYTRRFGLPLPDLVI